MSETDYHLVRNENGTCSIGCRQIGEVMHPQVGPEQEAKVLCVDGLNLRERAAQLEDVCIWDVGMGAASNALVAIRALQTLPLRLDLVSFDLTGEALRFALRHLPDFSFIGDLAPVLDDLLSEGEVSFTVDQLKVQWRFHEGGFLDELDGNPAPQFIFFDPWSPLNNSGAWTLDVFRQIHRRLSDSCSLSTFSRATCIRSALLLAGFHVGIGEGLGEGAEWTIAANDPTLLKNPLPKAWLGRAERSHSGRPLYSSKFTQEPLSVEMLAELQAHPQFQ